MSSPRPSTRLRALGIAPALCLRPTFAPKAQAAHDVKRQDWLIGSPEAWQRKYLDDVFGPEAFDFRSSGSGFALSIHFTGVENP